MTAASVTDTVIGVNGTLMPHRREPTSPSRAAGECPRVHASGNQNVMASIARPVLLIGRFHPLIHGRCRTRFVDRQLIMTFAAAPNLLPMQAAHTAKPVTDHSGNGLLTCEN
ncbi:hypothetical protein GCM10028790_06820 [Micromonospora taraxaci]